MMSEDVKVLSIQSHVVRGYVGNKSAAFPLQLHGFEVDCINSVHFSCHTFYKHWKGQVLNSDQLWEVYDGLRQNNVHNYTHLLTGYCADETFLDKISQIIDDLRTVNPDLYYVCDPVLGDHGKYYVPDKLMPIYRDTILPRAHVVTPNQFELQELSSVTVTDEESLFRAISVLHNRGNKCVVVTSTDLSHDTQLMYGYGSTLQSDGTIKRFRMHIPAVDAIFVGTGDLFTALLLCWLHKTNKDLKAACQKTLSSLQMILRKTLEHGKKISGDKKPTPIELELRLVQSQKELLDPDCTIEIVDL